MVFIKGRRRCASGCGKRHRRHSACLEAPYTEITDETAASYTANACGQEVAVEKEADDSPVRRVGSAAGLCRWAPPLLSGASDCKCVRFDGILDLWRGSGVWGERQLHERDAHIRDPCCKFPPCGCDDAFPADPDVVGKTVLVVVPGSLGRRRILHRCDAALALKHLPVTY